MTLPTLRISHLIITPKLQACGLIILTTVLYLFGFEWPLLLTTLAALAIYMPMPKIFTSWLSRSVVALLLLYALVQIAALIQFLVDPNGKFQLIAILLSALTIAGIVLFGKRASQEKYSLISFKDISIAIPCVLFIAILSPLLFSTHRLEKITDMASVQVSDSIAHYGMISNAMQVQNLNYKVNGYYPSGFHIATAFIEHSFLGSVSNADWKTHVVVYAGQYIFFGILMSFALLYLGYGLLRELGLNEHNERTTYLALAAAIGICTVLMHSLLFVSEGFLNFFYICATTLISLLYLLDRQPLYQPSRSLQQNIQNYTWPISAFLLLGFGASFSWTLLAPAILLSAALAMWPGAIRSIIKKPGAYLLANVSITILVLCNLVSVYFQDKYSTSNGQMFLASGAIHSFNLPFLILGLLAATYIIVRAGDKLGRRIVTVITPYVVLVALLLLAQLIILGEVRYYVVKTAILLELFSLVIVAVAAVYALRSVKLGRLFVLLWAPSLVFFLAIGTIALMPKPLLEVRNVLSALRPAESSMRTSDAKAIANLGANNHLQNFNATILHYDANGNKFYAQIETMAWANAMTRAFSDPALLVSNAKVLGGACFDAQFGILAYGTGSQEEQQRLIQSVNDCIDTAHLAKLPYYIITDGGSIPALKAAFGDRAVLVTE